MSLVYTKDAAIDVPIVLELSGVAVTGQAAGDITVKVANADSTGLETLTATTHYTLTELGEGDYMLEILAASNATDVEGPLMIKVSDASGTDFDTERYTVSIRDEVSNIFGETIDVLDFRAIMVRLLAVMGGNTTISGDQISYKKQDGSTTEATYEVLSTGQRTKQ